MNLIYFKPNPHRTSTAGLGICLVFLPPSTDMVVPRDQTHLKRNANVKQCLHDKVLIDNVGVEECK